MKEQLKIGLNFKVKRIVSNLSVFSFYNITNIIVCKLLMYYLNLDNSIFEIMDLKKVKSNKSLNKSCASSSSKNKRPSSSKGSKPKD